MHAAQAALGVAAAALEAAREALHADEDELRQREPGLHRRYKFGLLVEANAQCRDPGSLVAALVRHAVAQGAEIVASTPAAFATRVSGEIVKWRKVIQDAGIKPE